MGAGVACCRRTAVVAPTAQTNLAEGAGRTAFPKCSPTISVLQWNVLARPYTKQNHEAPKCIQGHRNPDSVVETQAQTTARYGLATAAILAQKPDAVLLQELEAAFFKEEINRDAVQLLAQYDMHSTNVEDGTAGTAVLLRKGGGFEWTGVTRRAGATEETGGTSKSATAALVSISCVDDPVGTSCWLVSTHFTPLKYNREGVRTHLGLLAELLRADTAADAPPPPRVVIGGDFNAEPHELAELQGSSCLGGYSRVSPLGDTGLSSNFSKSETIDHILLSPGWRVVGAAIEKKPCSPYASEGPAPAAVVGASDHVWQSVQLQLC